MESGRTRVTQLTFGFSNEVSFKYALEHLENCNRGSLRFSPKHFEQSFFVMELPPSQPPPLPQLDEFLKNSIARPSEGNGAEPAPSGAAIAASGGAGTTVPSPVPARPVGPVQVFTVTWLILCTFRPNSVLLFSSVPQTRRILLSKLVFYVIPRTFPCFSLALQEKTCLWMSCELSRPLSSDFACYHLSRKNLWFSIFVP